MSQTAYFEHSKESEMGVLGSILLKPETLKDAEKYITKGEDFFIQKHRTIWNAMKLLEKDDLQADMILVLGKLKEMKLLGTESGQIPAYYLSDLTEFVTSPSLIENYAKEVRQYAIKREIYIKSKKLEDACKLTYNDCMNETQKLTRDISEIRLTDDATTASVSTQIDSTMEGIEKGTNIIPFNTPFLDYSSNGVTRGGISVLGGRPGHGKTTLATSIAMDIANAGYRVLMFNRQIPNSEIHKKMIVRESGLLSYGKIRQGKYKYDINQEKVINLTEKEMELVEETKEVIKTKYKNLIMLDNVRTMPETITAIKNIDPDFVIDDYVQLIKGANKYEGRRFEIEDIMMEYEWQAKPSNCNFAGLLLSQLSREIEKRMDQRPRISDFSEAGAIEQIAESAFFIFYGHNLDAEEFPKHQAEIIFGKTRYGNLNSHRIGYNGDKCRYYLTTDEALEDK